MEEICAGATLFETMARSKAEWLAQGLLVRAIQKEKRLCRHLASLVGAKGDTPSLFTERYDDEEAPKGTKRGWRPDIVVKWGDKQLEIELKLLAKLSEAQVRGLQKPGALLIGPAWLKPGEGVQHMTWDQVSAMVREPLKQLFTEIEGYTQGTLRELNWATIKQDYGTIERDNKGWTSLYRFLSTVDQQLSDALDTYRPSDQWSLSRKPSPGSKSYYGYYLTLSGKESPLPYWLGFLRDEMGVVQLAVQKRKAKGAWDDALKWDEASARAPGVLRAEEVVTKILKLAR